MAYVEWQFLVSREDGERRGGTGRVPHPKFVEHVRIGGGEIRYREVAEQESLKHRLVYDPAGALFIGTHRFHAGCLDRRPDCLLVDCVEVDIGSAGWVFLDAERHQNET